MYYIMRKSYYVMHKLLRYAKNVLRYAAIITLGAIQALRNADGGGGGGV